MVASTLLQSESAAEPPASTDVSSSPQLSGHHIYKPLDTSRKEIRVLRLLPADSSQVHKKLHCELVTLSLLDAPHYECLSYCWGDANQQETISIDGHDVLVTRNLHDALHTFRDSAEASLDTFLLWADAVCINQNDIEERNHQVAQMVDIYTQASRVRCWLNWQTSTAEDAETIKTILGLVERVGAARIGRFSIKAMTEILSGLCPLFANIYWHRRWVTQELVVAKEVVLFFDRYIHALHQDTLAQTLPMCFYTWTAQKHKAIEAITPSDNMKEIITQTLGTVMGVAPEQAFHYHNEIAGRFRIVMLLSQAWTIARAQTSGATQSSSVLTSGANQFMFGFGCSQKHDYVFALQGIVPQDWRVAVDYRQSWQSIYAQFTRIIYDSTRSLNTLQFAPYDHSMLPSWAVDWSSTDPEQHIQIYVTSYNANLDLPYRPVSSAPEILTLQGLACGAISRTAQYVMPSEAVPGFRAEATQVRLWLITYMQHGRQDPHPVTTIMRVLCMDKSEFHPHDRYVDPRTRIEAEQLHKHAMKLNTLLVEDKDSGDQFFDKTLFRRVRRSYFFVTAEGLPGISTRPVEEGDVVYVLAGSGVPYVLRRQERDDREVWRIICHCYLDGIMYGEAITEAHERLKEEKPDAAIEHIFSEVELI